MQIQYRAEVMDRNGRVLGTVNQVVRDSWTGAANTDLLLSPGVISICTKKCMVLPYEIAGDANLCRSKTVLVPGYMKGARKKGYASMTQLHIFETESQEKYSPLPTEINFS